MLSAVHDDTVRSERRDNHAKMTKKIRVHFPVNFYYTGMKIMFKMLPPLQ